MLNVASIDGFGDQKKLYKLSKLGGGGGNLDKIKKNSSFSSGNRPLGSSIFLDSNVQSLRLLHIRTLLVLNDDEGGKQKLH